jgi:phosphotransferase system enzyme I (PtsI)
LDLILFYHQGIKAIVTEEGTFTSHTSIIASTLDISYIMGINNCLEIVKNDDIVIIDGFTGEIFINPEECVISQYKIKEKEQIKILNELANESISKSYTKDNKYIKIMSNMDIIEAPNSIDKYNVEGIGLARSEFMFHDREIIPSYQEQLLVYKELLIKNKNTEVTIRTFDFSEDKTPDTLKIFNQHNPSMGLRGIRFSFYQNIFKDQFKALIKSSLFGNLKILFPMITSYKEFLEIKKIESEILEELQIKKTYKIGIMVETISSVYILQDIYKEIDFVSLGTNDLMQYFFAVDRDNGFVKDLSSPFESSFIRFLKYVISEVNKYSIELSICGKIASVPSVIPILIGLDLETLSVSPLYIPIVKRIIKKISYNESKELVNKLINNPNVQENETIINTFLSKSGIEL